MHEVSKRVLIGTLLTGDEQGGDQPEAWDQPAEGDPVGSG